MKFNLIQLVQKGHSEAVEKYYLRYRTQEERRDEVWNEGFFSAIKICDKFFKKRINDAKKPDEFRLENRAKLYKPLDTIVKNYFKNHKKHDTSFVWKDAFTSGIQMSKDFFGRNIEDLMDEAKRMSEEQK